MATVSSPAPLPQPEPMMVSGNEHEDDDHKDNPASSFKLSLHDNPHISPSAYVPAMMTALSDDGMTDDEDDDLFIKSTANNDNGESPVLNLEESLLKGLNLHVKDDDCDNDTPTTMASSTYYPRSIAVEDPPTAEIKGEVVVTAIKPEVDGRVGITFVQQSGVGIIIKSIAADSIYAHTELQVGMKVLAIEDNWMFNEEGEQMLSKEEAAVLLRSSHGAITMRAIFPADEATKDEDDTDKEKEKSNLRIVRAIFTKETPESPIGLEVETNTNELGNPALLISKILPRGPCAVTPLREGMRILCVNGTDCQPTDNVMAQLQEMTGRIVILAGPPTMISASVDRTDVTKKLGLEFKVKRTPIDKANHKNNNSSSKSNNIEAPKEELQVKTIQDDSIFVKTNLRVGMILQQLNDMTIRELKPQDIQSILIPLQGKLTLIAEEIPASQQNVEHPPGTPPGGEWGTGTYFGPRSGLCAGVYNLMGSKKRNKRILYRAPNGNVYNKKGRHVGSESDTKFRYKDSS